MKAIAKTRPELGVEIIDAPMPRPFAEYCIAPVEKFTSTRIRS
jgi:hypothetical protein